MNKLVRNIDEAVVRVKNCAAPPNCIRLDCKTLAVKQERWYIPFNRGDMPSGCHSEALVSAVIMLFQHISVIRTDLKVILVAESLGY